MKAREVESYDDDLRSLVDRMSMLMEAAEAAGLAARQVGVLRRIFMFRPDEASEPAALVNPEIVERGEETEVDDEGCLSMQGVLVPVERHVQVTVAAKDPSGGDIHLELR